MLGLLTHTDDKHMNKEELELFIPLIGDLNDVKLAIESLDSLGLSKKEHDKLRTQIEDMLEDIEQTTY